MATWFSHWVILSICVLLGAGLADRGPEAAGRVPIQIRAPSKPMRVNDLTSTDVLVILSTTVHHQQLAEAQLNTFGLHFPTVHLTEVHVHECALCGNMDGTETHKGSFFDGAMPPRFIKQPLGWYCAKKLQHLQVVLEQLPQLPRYLVMIDGDTFLNPITTMKLLSKASAQDRPRILGNAYEGGAGYILNQRALERLLSEGPVTNMVWDSASSAWVKQGAVSLLGLCNRRGLGGSWCYAHDDHFVGACAHAANIPMKKLRTMHMTCRVGSFRTALQPPSAWLHNSSVTAWIKAEVMTCHYTDRETILAMYQVLTGDPEFSSFIL